MLQQISELLIAQIRARQPIVAQDEQQLRVIVAEVGQLPHTAGLQELSRWGSTTPVRSTCSRRLMRSMPMPASGNLPRSQLYQSISSA